MTSTVFDAQQHPRSAESGRFIVKEQAEAAARLSDADDDRYNREGTFLFPPHPRSLSQVCRFWLQVPVPDEAAARLQAAHDRLWGAWRDAEWGATVRKVASANGYLEKDPEPDFDTEREAHGEWLDRLNAALKQPEFKGAVYADLKARRRPVIRDTEAEIDAAVQDGIRAESADEDIITEKEVQR